MKKIKMILMIMALVFISACSSSNNSSKVTINVSGGTAVVPVVEEVAQLFQKENKNITINVNSDGSTAGIKAANEKVSQIGLSGRDLKEEEKAFKLTETVIARDALAIIVNPKNKIENVSIKQLNEIYTGKVTNWKEIGGSDIPISIISREEGSGSRTVFEEKTKLMDENEKSLIATNKAAIANSTGAVVENVTSKDGAIGYVSIGELKNDKIKGIKVDNVVANAKTVLADEYLISRPFILVSKDENKETKNFLDFIVSPKGQDVVEKQGLVRIK